MFHSLKGGWKWQALLCFHHVLSVGLGKAVKHGPCLMTLKNGCRLSKPSAWGNFSASPTWSIRPMTGRGARSTSGHLGGWVTPWSAEETLDGHQRVDIPAHARTARSGLLQKTREENLCWILCHVPPTTQSVKGLNWTELNWNLAWRVLFACYTGMIAIPKRVNRFPV